MVPKGAFGQCAHDRGRRFQHRAAIMGALAERSFGNHFASSSTKWFPKERSANAPMIAVGDFNIAPLENDVWDHKKMLKVVSHTPVEVEKFAKFQNAVNWVDGVRHFV